MLPSVGSSNPPIIRRVVVFPQPDGPNSAKKEPRSISSERLSTATTSPNRFVTCSSRTSATSAPARAPSRWPVTLATLAVLRAVDSGAPLVQLLPQLEVEKGLGRRDAAERAHTARDVEEVTAVPAHDLDEQVELARRDDDVVRLLPAGDLVGDGLRRAGCPDADHRALESEPELVRDAG